MKLPPEHVPGVGIVKNGGFGGFGQRMMEKMGWSMGEGLGKKRDGVTEPIKVRQKNDTQGLGCRKGVEWNNHQWTQIYEESLNQLSHIEESSGSESSEDENQTCQKENPDGTASTAAQEELQIYERLSKRAKLGQWSSRKGKLERIKRQEQLMIQKSTSMPCKAKPKCKKNQILKNSKTKSKQRTGCIAARTKRDKRQNLEQCRMPSSK